MEDFVKGASSLTAKPWVGEFYHRYLDFSFLDAFFQIFIGQTWQVSAEARSTRSIWFQNK